MKRTKSTYIKKFGNKWYCLNQDLDEDCFPCDICDLRFGIDKCGSNTTECFPMSTKEGNVDQIFKDGGYWKEIGEK